MTRGILLICCWLSVACTETITKIAVAPASAGSASVAAESKRVEKICAAVAATHGLKERTPAQVSGVTEYSAPMPLSPGGFGGPSILLSVITSDDLAIVAVNGTGSPRPTSVRLQIAGELKAKLSQQFGQSRVKVYEETGMPW